MTSYFSPRVVIVLFYLSSVMFPFFYFYFFNGARLQMTPEQAVVGLSYASLLSGSAFLGTFVKIKSRTFKLIGIKRLFKLEHLFLILFLTVYAILFLIYSRQLNWSGSRSELAQTLTPFVFHAFLQGGLFLVLFGRVKFEISMFNFWLILILAICVLALSYFGGKARALHLGLLVLYLSSPIINSRFLRVLIVFYIGIFVLSMFLETQNIFSWYDVYYGGDFGRVNDRFHTLSTSLKPWLWEWELIRAVEFMKYIQPIGGGNAFKHTFMELQFNKSTFISSIPSTQYIEFTYYFSYFAPLVFFVIGVIGQKLMSAQYSESIYISYMYFCMFININIFSFGGYSFQKIDLFMLQFIAGIILFSLFYRKKNIVDQNTP